MIAPRSLILLFIGVVLLGSCSNLKQLNALVDHSERQAIQTSPFKSAGSVTGDLDRQKKIRSLYLAEIDKLRNKFPEDTIILTEFFAPGCLSCPAEFIDIMVNGKIILYELSSKDGKYTKKEVSEQSNKAQYLSYSFHDAEIFKELRKGSWNSNPAYYGDECKEGGHRFFTVFFPGSKVESLYVPCWTLKAGGGKW